MTTSNLVLVYSLVLVNIFISLKFKLRLEKSLFIASARTFIQLIILALVIKYLFELNSIYITIITLFIMTINSGVESTIRVKNKYPSLYLTNITSSFIAIWPLSFYSSRLLSSTDWFTPQQLLPLMGMLLGNSLNSMSIGVDRYITDLYNKQDEIYGLFSLGANNYEAQKSILKDSIKAAMTPNINAMSSMGIVNIPGMMTGQLLAGANPLTAAKYQIYIMFLICSGAFLGTALGLFFCYKNFFKRRAQLCLK